MSPIHHHDFLIRGSDHLAATPDFKLEGREKELERLSAALMRSKANNVLLVGPGGVGASALCKGLQASKDDPNTPFDIVNKRFFWLDTDGLFSSGDTTAINETFNKILGTLRQSPETVLVIDDARGFIDGARNNGCGHLINAMMRDVEKKKFQLILEARDDDMELVLKSHSDFREHLTMLDLAEPTGENLKKISVHAAARLEQFHGIRISQDAIDTAIELTTKYRVRDMGLSRAQPERMTTLLDRALTTYRLHAHARAPECATLEEQRNAVAKAIDTGHPSPELQGRTAEELESLRAVLTIEIQQTEDAWKKRQAEIRKLHIEQHDGEEAIRRLETEIEKIKEDEEKNRAEAAQPREQNAPKGKIPALTLGFTNMESEKVMAIKRKIETYEHLVAKNKARYDALAAEVNRGLLLTRDHVLTEFSQISNIPVNRLGQDERLKLLKLEDNLKSRVFGQDHAVESLADSVAMAGVGLQESNKPQAAFMFLGPSGVGKTELAKALTGELFGDERALVRFDMSEYMEQHAVAKLIGAPPGYEGYEAGGILTNTIRRNPRCVVLFDEIEKAHKDVFNLFLQILDDARLTDNRGLTVSFSDAIIVMTTNIGTKHFLDSHLAVEEGRERALSDLEETYRPEFLNRFNGRQNIVCFNRLELPTIEKIAARTLRKINDKIGEKGLSVSMSESDLAAMCRDRYSYVGGARSITGYIDNIKSMLAKTILRAPEAEGAMIATYDSTKGLSLSPPQKPAPEQDRTPPSGTLRTAAGQNFKPS